MPGARRVCPVYPRAQVCAGRFADDAPIGVEEGVMRSQTFIDRAPAVCTWMIVASLYGAV
jgi:hypothetical protein